jgi:hypothetical protein
MKGRALSLLLEAIRLAMHDWRTPNRVLRALDEDWRRAKHLMNQQHPGDGYYLNRKRHRLLRLPVIRHLRYLWHSDRADQHAKDCGIDERARAAIRAAGGFYVDDWHLYALRRGWW